MLATNGGDAAITAKRVATKKARNIVRSREDFLALQAPSSTSTDVTDMIQVDVAKVFEYSQTVGRTKDPAKKDAVDLPSDSRPSKTVKLALKDDDIADEDEDNEGRKCSPVDTAKAAFPPLVSGRSWDAIVRMSSSSVEEPVAAGKVDGRPSEPRRTAAAARLAFSASRAETTLGISDADTGRSSRPILQMAKSVDSEPSASGAINMDPQLAAVLRMRKKREEELEREEAVMKAEETEKSQYAENRYVRVENLALLF